MLLFAISSVTFFAIEVLINPYSRYLGTMPGITGIFYRSVLVTSILITVWIYKYGWVHATIMAFTYYGFGNLIFNILFFASYDQNFILNSGYSNEVWTIRIMIMLSSIILIVYYKLYSITFASTSTSFAYIGYTLLMIYLLPLKWLSGEGNIPLQPLPQSLEFISIVLSAIFAYQFLRWRT